MQVATATTEIPPRGVGLPSCNHGSSDGSIPSSDTERFPVQFHEHSRRVGQLQLLRPQHLVHNAAMQESKVEY